VTEHPASQPPPATGHARVDEVVARLADLDRLPPHEHVAVFEEVQRRLDEALTDLDQG
jgi:hypothetical protein